MKTDILHSLIIAGSLALIAPCAFAEETSDVTFHESDNLPDQYLKNLHNYKFKNTRGMKDLAPNRIPWIPENRQDPDQWEFPTESDAAKISDAGVTLPSFDFIEGGELEAGQQRQPTHIVEHIIYARPGDAISLYPYYGLEEYRKVGENAPIVSTTDFLETFSHWYDYKTGGRVIHKSEETGKSYDLLDFPYDRQYIQISDYGFYGGIYMSDGGRNDIPGLASTYKVSNADEYNNAVVAINNNDGKGNIVIVGNLDFTGKNIELLGSENRPFIGVIDGNCYTISNMTISSNDDCIGLIRYAGDGAALYNLVFDNCNISGNTQVGLVGFHYGGGLTVKNLTIKDNCSITGKKNDGEENFVSGILGRSPNEVDNHLTIENVYIGGRIGNPVNTPEDQKYKKNTAICGWLMTSAASTPSYFKNIVVNCEIEGMENLGREAYVRHFLGDDPVKDDNTGIYTENTGSTKFYFTNCYGNIIREEYPEPTWLSFNPDEIDNITDGWFDKIDSNIGKVNIGGDLINERNQNRRPWYGDITNENDDDQRRRKAGTSAVFYFPETIENEWDENKEYVIAADFSQTFYPDEKHIDVDNMEVVEPLIAFRHIFRIRDARQQTEELQNSNSDYARKNQHRVTAMTGTKFQIRLDSPLPTGDGQRGVTNYYYINPGTGKYERIRRYRIRVLDGDTRTLLDGQQGFYFWTNIRMRRSRPAGDYAESDNQYAYDMMLKKDAPGKGHFLVQVLAEDLNGNLINTGTGDMILMQYDIRFVDSSSASLLTEAELYSEDRKFRHAQDEYLKEKYGDTQFKIDFDNYFEINKLSDETLRNKFISYTVPTFGNGVPREEGWYWPEGREKDNLVVYAGKSAYDSSSRMQHSFYKWPIAWERSTYSYGYNYRYNYSMYMLATHTENVPYHASADRWDGNNEGDGNGLYDRLYYKTKRMRQSNKNIKQEQGYFYYVNAASDPGVSARIDVDLPCPGSRVIVSAWVAELTKMPDAPDEAANISFNFVAVMKETNERVTLHNFITGYIPDSKLGQWCNVYYSFIPRMSEFFNDTKTFSDVDHFELELAHNGESSEGADYAIDDIRAYVVPSSAEATPDGYYCDGEVLPLTIQTSFETLLEKLGQAEGYTSNKQLDLYYAVVDKDKFDDDHSMEDAIIRKIDFNNKFSVNPSYVDENGNRLNNIDKNKAYSLTNEAGDRMIVFETDANGKFKVGKEYYVVFRSYLPEEGSATEGNVPDPFTPANFFDLGEDCSYYCLMTVTPALEIKIDGVVMPEFNALEVCENQMPVVQLNVLSTELKDNEKVTVMKNAYFDWFDGTLNDFENYRFKNYPASMEVVHDYTKETDTKNLQSALKVFRDIYPDAESTTGIKIDNQVASDGKKLEQWMLDIIDIASSAGETGLPKLVLHQASFVVPPVNLEDKSSAKTYFVAIPIIDLYWTDSQGEFTSGEGVAVCSAPTEIGISIENSTPVILHGLTAPDINYPADLYDVPLRLGLNQILDTSDVASSSMNVAKKDLDMPLRVVASTDGRARTFKLVEEETLINNNKLTKTGCILLSQTNDPAYRNLGTLTDSKQETGYLLWVGEIKEFNAYSVDGASSSPDSRRYFVADFDNSFNFKEGYYYRMRYQFEENHDEGIDADAATICNGQDMFTIKVVPQYLKWTGDKNLSWDNDANWSRLSTEDISKSDANGNDSRFTDKDQSNRIGYAPLDFTRVVIAKPDVSSADNSEDVEISGENPWLYIPAKVITEVNDEYNQEKKHLWTADPTRKPTAEESETSGNIGDPTALIQYDMTAYNADGNVKKIYCRPWVANNCREIHFLPGATIMNQQALNYEKAWVDVEIDHSRWYILSTPLQDIYAGDFYLPTQKARQETEIFTEINFDPTLNDRFAPAVYQRSWDKSEAKVYELNKNGSHNAAVKTFWSHAYNDVKENYGNGNAFSIKTDVSKAIDVKDNDKVLFRLPKADTRYDYYTSEKATGNHTDVLTKDNAYRLNITNSDENPMEVSNMSGKYFLVGNPFMTYMDIEKFLDKNSDKLEKKYWIITKDGQIAVTWAEGQSYAAYPATDSPEDCSVVAPMQGFFVEAKPNIDATTLSLKYDESMMRRYNAGSGVILNEVTRGETSSPALKISAVTDGKSTSTAILVTGIDASDESCVEAIDQRDLDIPSTVFTAKHGKAMSINFCENVEGVEIGVIADDDAETVIRFEGMENFNDLLLFDSSDKSVTPLSEVGDLKVKGSVNGRFFLTAGLDDNASFNGLKWSADDNILTVTDTASTGDLKVRVCDLLGRVIANVAVSSDTASIPLDKGVFVVKMMNMNEEMTVKIRL
ncbi:MAG: T9SS type A sorting domain-containing protein [Muribaculaceae bacterium]|nr:T9SS type A sorting domain-containing protein [Muribaculaceae bacterium]